MKRCKKILAFLMAFVIAATSFELPVLSVHAQEAEEKIATYSDAGDAAVITDITVGQTKVTISTGGEKPQFRFVPETTGTYHIYAASESMDTVGTLYDSEGNKLAYSDDDSGNENDSDFGICYTLTAGEEYIIEVQFYNSSSTGSFDITVEKFAGIRSVEIGGHSTDFIEGIPSSYIAMDAEIILEDGTKKLTGTNGEVSFSVQGQNFDVWIKDADGSYAYFNPDGYMTDYRYMNKLTAGTYTVEIRDDQKVSDESAPAENSVLYTSYKINVKTPDDYLAGRPVISETEDRTFTVGNYGYEYYKFEPSQTGKYYFPWFTTGNEKQHVYCSDGTQVFIRDKKISVEQGKTYYIGFRGYRYDDDGNEIDNVTGHAIENNVPESASWNFDRTELVQYVDSNPFRDTEINVSYSNGKTEKLKAQDSYYQAYNDDYGNTYQVFYASENEEWNAHEFYSCNFEKGTYTFSLGYYSDSSSYTKLCSQTVEIKSITDLDVPELQEGQVTLHYASDKYDNNIYKFTMPYDGKISFSPYVSYTIYDASGNSFSSNYMTKGQTYYIAVDGIREADSDNHTAEVKLQFVPVITAIEIAEQPYTTEYIYGVDRDFYTGAKLKVTYSNGDTENIDADSYIYTDLGDYIECRYIDENNETWYHYHDIPCGSYEVVFKTDNDVKCSYKVTVKKFSDLADVPELQQGDNEVVTDGKRATYYRFVPSTTGVYNIKADSGLRIYKEDSEGRAESLEDIQYSNGVCKILLEKDTTYYMDIKCGSTDEWGDPVTEWNMTITLPESQILSAPVSWNATGNVFSKKLIYCTGISWYTVESACRDLSIKVSYEDESSDTVKPFGYYENGPQDKFQNKFKYEILKYDAAEETYTKYNGDDDYPTGQYKCQIKLYSNDKAEYTNLSPIEIPFTIYDPADAPDGDWNISNALYVNNTNTTRIYRLVIPEGMQAVTIETNAYIYDLSIYDKEGNSIKVISSDLDDSYRCQFDVPDGDVYMAIRPGSADTCKLTATANKAITAIETTVDRTEYWAGINDSISADSVKCKITYADGTQETMKASDSNAVSMYIEEKEDKSTYDLGRRLYDSGIYYLKADVVGKVSDCKETYAEITVKDYDIDSLPAIEPGVETTIKNDQAQDVLKLYTVSSSEDSMYTYTYTGGSISVWNNGKSGIPADQTCIIKVPVKAESTETLTFSPYPAVIRNEIKLNEDMIVDKRFDNQDYEFTFVPDKDGLYVIESSSLNDADNNEDSSVDPRVDLYQDDERLSGDDDGGDGNNFKLSYNLKKGVSYRYVVYTYSDTKGKFKVRLSSADDLVKINQIKLSTEEFGVVKSDDAYSISGEYVIKYSDNTEKNQYYDSDSNQYKDAYGNKTQIAYTIITEDDVEYAQITVRYKNLIDDDWTVADSIKIKVTVKEKENWDTVAEENVRYTPGPGVTLYKFCPTVTAKYVIQMNDESYVEDVKDLDTGNYISRQNGGYEFVAGREYGIYFNGERYEDEDDDVIYMMITKATAIADVEVLNYTGILYDLLDNDISYNDVTVRVTYVDGTDVDCSLKDLRDSNKSISCSVSEGNAEGATIHVSVDGITAHMSISYDQYYEVKNITLGKEISFFTPSVKTAYISDAATVYKLVMPQDGTYCLGYSQETSEVIYGAKAGEKWSILNANSRLICKKGDIYYITVKTYETADPVYIGLMSEMDWKVVTKPTCTKTGRKVKLNVTTGVYEEAVIPALGHSFTKYTYDNNASCTKAGTKTALCDHGCKTKKTVSDPAHPALGHSYGTTWVLVQKAQPGKDGYKAKLCTRCKTQSKDKQIIAKINTVTLKKTSYVYNGKAKKPGVTVKDSKNKTISKQNYTVSYSNNTAVGTATVTVTFKDNYQGQVKKTFVINPTAVNVKGLENVAGGVKISWKKSASGASYLIYRKTKKGSFKKVAAVANTRTTSYIDSTAKNATEYTYRIVAYKKSGSTSYRAKAGSTKTALYVAAPKLTGFKNTAKKTAVVKWKKNTKATGYEIQYATSKSFKKAKIVNITGKKNVTKTIKGLTKNKRYYVRVRAYKRQGQTAMYYSGWSKPKNVKIKK